MRFHRSIASFSYCTTWRDSTRQRSSRSPDYAKVQCVFACTGHDWRCERNSQSASTVWIEGRRPLHQEASRHDAARYSPHCRSIWTRRLTLKCAKSWRSTWPAVSHAKHSFQILSRRSSGVEDTILPVRHGNKARCATKYLLNIAGFWHRCSNLPTVAPDFSPVLEAQLLSGVTNRLSLAFLCYRERKGPG